MLPETDSEKIETAHVRELLLKAAAGDRQAFADLYTACFPGLFRFVHITTRSRTDAEEVIQDIFLKLWERRETLTGIHSLQDYLFIMARHRLFDQARQQTTRLKAVQELGAAQHAAADTVEGALIYKEYERAAIDAITRLPKRRQLIFFMRTQQSMSLNEIAAAFRISRSAVKKHLYASIHFIKQQLRLEQRH
ncbi:MAG TPA: sigma-70 family RNA polymerase sigma factor [Chitinophaga sp.]|uniref:RNA polymerase sigma factor n=1 Tax=Chitinophaga sp. TaxID=1869181 RepID=UPI002DBCDA93|nr:sigma-70 family RNA polymerase sigma factor [Chitinophaga sp.]HEU4555409.1 sigma-70 family RNA polymerase sigma factor [Chitinophaga sp.]